jgi:uncharacterized protein YdhG (YjbR/CyaY superfamily)
MQSQAQTVAAYLNEVPAERRPALEQLRRLCHEYLVGFDESMTYGMPCYSRNGVVEVAFASQKNNIALYILRTDVLDQHRTAFAASAIGKGCIRYRNPNTIDYTIVSAMLKQTAEVVGTVCA